MGDDLGEVGCGGVVVVGADDGEEAEGFVFDGGFGVGNGVVEAVEDHGDGVRGEGLDGSLEVFYCDLVGVSVGELREGG